MALNPWWQTSSIAFSRLKSHPRVFWFQMINDQAQPTWTIRTHRLSRESDSFSLFVATRRVWKHFEIGKVISRLEASSGDTGGWFKWDFAFLVLNNCQVLFCCNHKHLILRCFKLLWFNRMPFYDLYCIHNKNWLRNTCLRLFNLSDRFLYDHMAHMKSRKGLEISWSEFIFRYSGINQMYDENRFLFGCFLVSHVLDIFVSKNEATQLVGVNFLIFC